MLNHRLKNRRVLICTIALSILVEVILMILVYNAVGTARLPQQVTRLAVKFLLIAFIFERESKGALLALTGYHIFSALISFAHSNFDLTDKMLFIYHLVIGLTIYFYDTVEKWISKKNNDAC